MTGAAFNMNGGGGRPPQGYARSATDCRFTIGSDSEYMITSASELISDQCSLRLRNLLTCAIKLVSGDDIVVVG